MSNAEVEKTLVGRGTSFVGKLTSEGAVVVSGSLDGEVAAPELEVTESGRLAGKVKVQSLRSRGEISGEIEADTLVLAGRVRDDTVLRARSLEVKLEEAEGGTLALTFGTCSLSVGEAAGGPRQNGKKNR